MKKARIEEIKSEAKRRLDEWITNSSFEEMSSHGSQMRFDMSLGLYKGYPLKKPKWMKDKSFDAFVTESEFHSNEYDNIIEELFEFAEKL
tara:strand:- start:97745 stop:98014 length:270 start_codon:yes stop_codon:yes gene_type:complete